MFNFACIMTAAEFEKVSVAFESDWDPVRMKPLQYSFAQKDFKEVSGDNNLFKLAAHQMIKDPATATQKQLQLSLTYKVLCDQTAFVGIIRQKNKSTEKPVKVNIPIVAAQDYQQPPPRAYGFGGSAMPMGGFGGSAMSMGGFGGGSAMKKSKAKPASRGMAQQSQGMMMAELSQPMDMMAKP